MVKISVLGHFGKGKKLLNGQTIKTKIVTDELKNQLGENQVIEFDTCGGLKALFRAPFQVLKALRKGSNVIILPAQNGLKVYVPLLNFFNKFFKNKKLHYVVIGGWLAEFLKNKKALSKKLKKFDGIYVETFTMKVALEKQGFKNIIVMPNCKELAILDKKDLVYPKALPYKLCTFSRVSKEKGIETAVNAVKTVNERLGYQAFSLDVYGQIDTLQTDWFKGLQKDFPDFIKYCGLVDFDKSVQVLKDYFVLLFPTYYQGEGFAGTLLDAYSAGLPVIATDWKYNSEIINEKVGCVYPTFNDNALVDILTDIANNSGKILEKKENCLIEAQRYLPSVAIKILVDRL